MSPARRYPAVEKQTIPRYEPRFGRTRPLIAVVGDNDATELTDYVVPYGMLVESGAADVVALSTRRGPIRMIPALRFEAQATLAEFETRYPEGADYVIVPNIYDGAKNGVILDWVRRQSKQGATIVGICDGVPVLANTGLLEGRRATGHWRTIDDLERNNPKTRWLRNSRYVVDGKIITTSGVSASVPISLALIEAFAGRERAEAVAATVGVTGWTSVHDSEQFTLGTKLLTGLRNKAFVWQHEELGLEAPANVDEISLAITADVYSRTRRSRAVAVGSSIVRTQRGLTLLPDRATAPQTMLPLTNSLDVALKGIEERYGKATARFVAVQIEYPLDI